VKEAQNAGMSSCRAKMSSCEIKGSFCDTVDEAATATQRKQAEEQAADDARRRVAAEQPTKEAEQRAKQANDNAKPPPSEAGPARPPLQLQAQAPSIPRNTGIGLGLVAMLAMALVIFKEGYPKIAALTLLLMPAASFLIYWFTGIGLKEHMTLYDWPIFSPILGGAVVAIAALFHKIQA
jgi:hypothetical protein